MKRTIIIASCALVGVLFACSELFDEPSQCKSDRDCTKFGGVCDVTNAVCVPAPPGTGSEGGPSGDGSGITDAAEEPSPPPPPGCEVTDKEVAAVPTTLNGTTAEIGTNVTLDCTKDWLLNDRAFVNAGVTVTIQPGTKIFAGTGAGLIVRSGATLIAKGFKDQPIVFTVAGATPAAGSWRGLFILGQAPPQNTGGFAGDTALPYGGNAADSNSGDLEFVRIEYSQTGLVLAGVGSGTKVDSVQVRRATDDCYSIQGGRVNVKHLVCMFPGDEMFTFAGGYQGKAQFLFGHKTPSGGGHNGLLVDANSLLTAYNITMCGDNVANQGFGLLVRANGRGDIVNGIYTGWLSGFDVVNDAGAPLNVKSSIFGDNMNNPAFVETDAGANNTLDDDGDFDEIGYLADAGGNSTNSAGLVACYNTTAPQPWPPAKINGATPPNDMFFDTNANYVGAFRDSNDAWMTGPWIKLTDP